MSVQLLGKRELKRLASVANDGAGAGYSGFAQGMMAKMGWAEGQGLGKDMQGRSTYVQVKKKDDNAGLGKEKAQQNNVNDQWYFNAFDSALANMGGKKKRDKKRKKDKKKKKSKTEGGDDEPAEAENGGGMSMYDKMFKATGGARMGMRARASQNGKLARTEGGKDGVGGGPPASAVDSVNGETKGSEAVEGGFGSTGHKRKRAVDVGDSSGKEVPDRVEGVVVKEEKRLGEGKAVANKEVKREAEAPGASKKAERKRERSASKKAKRAGKVAKEEGTLSVGADSGGDDVEGAAPASSAPASEKEQERARKKREKRERKENKRARMEA